MTTASHAELVSTNAPLEQSPRATSIQLIPTFAQSVELVLTYVPMKQLAFPKEVDAFSYTNTRRSFETAFFWLQYSCQEVISGKWKHQLYALVQSKHSYDVVK